MDGQRLDFKFDAAQVAVSVFISFMGSIAAVELNETRRFETNAWKRRKLAVAVAGVVGTSSIWCMHFVGMAALLLFSPEGEIIEIRYRIDMTIASWAAAVAVQALGVWIVAAKDPFFSAVDRDCALDLIRQEFRCKSIKTLKHRSSELLVATIRVQWILVGGLISGIGVSVMHYLGILSQVSDAQPSPRSDFILLSVVLAVSAATAAFWILFRLPLLFWDNIYLRLSSAGLMTLAVCSMHYSGMYGVAYEYAPRQGTVDGTSIARKTETFIAVFLALIVFAGVMTWLIAQLRAQMAAVAEERSRNGTRSGTQTSVSHDVKNSQMQSTAMSMNQPSVNSASRNHHEKRFNKITPSKVHTHVPSALEVPTYTVVSSSVGSSENLAGSRRASNISKIDPARSSESSVASQKTPPRVRLVFDGTHSLPVPSSLMADCLSEHQQDQIETAYCTSV